MHMAPHQESQRHNPQIFGTVQKSRSSTTMILESYLPGDRTVIENQSLVDILLKVYNGSF